MLFCDVHNFFTTNRQNKKFCFLFSNLNIFSDALQRSLVIVTNSDFLIPISLQSNVEDL